MSEREEWRMSCAHTNSQILSTITDIRETERESRGYGGMKRDGDKFRRKNDSI
jgi:hypothetical protein